VRPTAPTRNNFGVLATDPPPGLLRPFRARASVYTFWRVTLFKCVPQSEQSVGAPVAITRSRLLARIWRKK
jgi:hypothetical protein